MRKPQICLLALALAASQVHASTLWKANPATAADWFTPGNWTAELPAAGSNTLIDNGGTAQIQSGAASTQFLSVGRTTGAGSILLSSGSLQASFSESIGATGTGSVSQSGGTNTSSFIHIGFSAGSAGTYTLTNGTLTATSTETIGDNGSGDFHQSGGTHNPNQLTIGDQGTGTYSLSAGALNVTTTLAIGGSATGALDQSGGMITLPSINIAPTGAYHLTGGTLNLSAGLINAGDLAVSGNTTLNLGGMVNLSHADLSSVSQVTVIGAANSLIILPQGVSTSNFAAFSNPPGMTVLAGSPITIAAGVTVAGGAGSADDLLLCSGTLTGTCNLNAGVVVQHPNADVSAGEITIDNNSSALTQGTLTAVTEYVGRTAAADFTQSTGSNTVSKVLVLGSAAAANGTYRLLTGSLNVTGGREQIGVSGIGNFYQSGGTHTVTPAAQSGPVLGVNAGSTGNFFLTDGTLDSNFVTVGSAGTGNFNQSGGTHTAKSITLATFGTGAGSYSLSGTGILTTNSFSFAKGSGTLSISGGSATVNGTMSLLNANQDVDPSGGSLSVTSLKLTNGTFRHTAGNFTASTITSTGNLFLNAPATIDAITLNAGTLAGHGQISGQVLAGSAAHTIAPSATLPATSTGTLTAGSLTTNANTTLALNLVTPANHDALNITTTNGLTLNGGQIQIANVPNTPSSLGYYKIIRYAGTIQGAGLASITLPATADNIAYTADTSTNPGFITLHRGYLGDANDDGSVNFADFVQLSNHYGQSNQGWLGADFNNDHTTNFADFVILSNHYGQSITGNAFTATPEDLAALNAFAAANVPIPEPATAATLALGLLPLLARRRHRPQPH